MKQYHLVVNPVSGHKRGISIADQVIKKFSKAGISCELNICQHAGHATEITKKISFDSRDGLCVIGGDGTIHEVINGMFQRSDNKRLPLGIIPAGTGNSLMHDLDCLNVPEAIQKIIYGVLRPLDLFEIQTPDQLIYSFNVLGWGIPVDINIQAEKIRWAFGQRYNIATLIEIFKNRIRPAKIIIEGKEVVGNFAMVLALNTMYTGNGMKMAPNAKFDDGLIDLLFVRNIGRRKTLSLFTKVFKGTHFDDPVINHYLVREFSIISEHQEGLNIDGQNTGKSPIDVKVLPGAIQIFV